MTRLFDRLFRGRRGADAGQGTPEAVRAAERDADKREMMRGVQDLGETTVKEVMVPRIDTVFLPVDLERGELLEKVVACGHSRIPVYSGGIDSAG